MDALNDRLKTEKNIDSILKIRNELAVEIKNLISFDSAVVYLEATVDLALKNKRDLPLGDAYRNLCNIYLNKNEYAIAIDFNDKAIEVFKRIESYDNLSVVYTYRSTIYQSQSDFTNHLKYALEAFDVAMKSKVPAAICIAANNLAMYYLDQGEHEKALNFAKLATINGVLSGDVKRITGGLTGLAESYRILGDTTNAIKYFELGYQIAVKNNLRMTQAWFLTNWSGMLSDEDALTNRRKAEEIWATVGMNIMRIYNLGKLGSNYLNKFKKEKDPTKKNIYLDSANYFLNIATENAIDKSDFLSSIEISKTLADYYFYNKKYDLAYEYLQNSVHLNDSLFSQDMKNQLAKIESEKEIELKNKEIEINEVKLKSRERQLVLFVAVIILFAILGILLFVQSSNRKKINQKLSNLNSDLDKANQAKLKFLAILNHDLRGPISNLVHFLQLQKEHPDVLDEQTKIDFQNKLSNSAENLLLSMEDILIWSKNQMNSFEPHYKKVLIADIFKSNEIMFHQTEVSIKYELADDRLEVVTDENYLKTIVRNLTGNALKSMQQKPYGSIVWRAHNENDTLVLSIQDNGKGAELSSFKALFEDTTDTLAKSGLGFHLIRELANTIGVEFEVNSVINEGTTIVIRFKTI
jgi:signal transduction histidine kinase